MKTTTKATLVALYITALGVGIHSTKNTDSETGEPVHTTVCAAGERWATDDGYGGDCVPTDAVHDHAEVEPVCVTLYRSEQPEFTEDDDNITVC